MTHKKNLKSILPSIKTKLLLSFFLVIIVSVTFVTYFSISAYSERLEANNIKYSNQVISNFVGNINNYILEIDNVSDSILYNFYIQRFLIEKEALKDQPVSTIEDDGHYSDYYQGSSDALSNIINLRSDISSIFLINDSGVSLYKSRYKDVDLIKLHNTVKRDIVPLMMNQDEVYKISEVTYYRNSFLALTTTKNFERYDGPDSLGLIHIDTDLSVVKKYGDSAVLNEGGILVVIDEFGNFVYQSPSNVIPEGTFPYLHDFAINLADNRDQNSDNGFFLHKIGDESYYFVYQTIRRTGWTVATVTPYSQILSEVNEIRNSIIIIVLISLCIILLITYFVATSITKPIIVLKNSMDEADRNGFNTMVEVTSKDEIGDLSLSFNHMIGRIKDLMDEVVTEQEEKRSAEIKVLQDQINPHFLYNTLDTIIWMAEVNDENTVPMIEALSNIFRISLSKGQEFITIAEELEHTKNYLYILKTRYLDKFDYAIDADPNLLQHSLPKIILQPLIENAIYHGIKNIPDKGHIDIVVALVEDNICISITDNGIGMDEDTCKKLLSNDERINVRSTGSGVGIRNVNQRIKLYFGDEYGLEYTSTEGKGTTVQVLLPF